MEWINNDGGRANAGFTGVAGDCVARSIAIAAELPYQEVYDYLANGNFEQRKGKYTPKKPRDAGNGINTKRKWFKDYMALLGFYWVPTMSIGSGCKVHLRKGELPSNSRIIAKVSKHYVAVINGDIHDNHDCMRGGTRCVYGYWTMKGETE